MAYILEIQVAQYTTVMQDFSAGGAFGVAGLMSGCKDTRC